MGALRSLGIGVLVGGIAVALVVAAATFTAMPRGTGQLAVAVHDAPCANCRHVWVTFTAVGVHASNLSNAPGNGSDGGWTTLNVTGQTVDLVSLNGSVFAKTIGLLTLPVGQYEQIRLAIANVTVVLADGTTLVAKLSGNGDADIHGSFNVTGGATTTVSIDIDLASSVHLTGNGSVMFTPNIGQVSVS